MPYRVTPTVWLKAETDRVELMLLSPHRQGVMWDAKSAKEMLRAAGLEYTPAQMQAIVDELLRRGTLEQV